jgi:AraC-like DNA-binding protein
MEEMFVIFRHFYSREVFLRTFYSMFNNNMSFRTLVENNAPNARNVEALARMCGHSLSHFKLLFSQHFDQTPYVWMQQNRAVEISALLNDTSIPIKSIIKKYGFTSHGHFSLFCRKFLGDTPRALRRRSHLGIVTTIEDVKKNLEHSRHKSKANNPTTDVAPRRRGRPRKDETK